MDNGFFRVAACVPPVSVADCRANVKEIRDMLFDLSGNGVKLAVFPEMCITAYTCADLFHNRQLLDASHEALEQLIQWSEDEFDCAAIVGAPFEYKGAVYNCAFVIAGGKLLAIVPKTYIPNYNEFYEKRWFASGPQSVELVDFEGVDGKVPFGSRQTVKIDGVRVGVEICEDLWSPVPPSSYLALGGAQVIANLSASDDLIGKYAYLRGLISQQSARCICGYVYASAGYGESSTDLVFDGKAIVAENGVTLVANERWQSGAQHVVADLDILAIGRDRMHNGTFHDCASMEAAQAAPFKSMSEYNTWENENFSEVESNGMKGLYRKVSPTPFVPSTDYHVAERCSEIVNIQAAGLAKRLDFVKSRALVVGISGGLDSTLALLVAVKAYDRLGLDRKGIIGVTMPGFGTSGRTKGNALKLMEELGVTIREISIAAAVEQHFSDIGHDPAVHDTTYENSQARERTQILMDVANQQGGLVLGTGDLSELALGWATYNGDHMSMYGVNAGVPKTLVKYLVKHFAIDPAFASCSNTLLDIVDTPISPELIPADADGNISQKTEDLVGPYDLHDFFLYYTLRYGFTPQRIFFLAKHAFGDSYEEAEIKKWLKVFFKRFFQQQFKRSCLPDGPKVGSVCLSPRGDWRMPSDASASSWLQDA